MTSPPPRSLALVTGASSGIGRDLAASASLSTKLQGRGSRPLPDNAKAAMYRKTAEPGSGDPE
jgi:NADP-dependent 3-hydroxy acid dehydrogenase YdfG